MSFESCFSLFISYFVFLSLIIFSFTVVILTLTFVYMWFSFIKKYLENTRSFLFLQRRHLMCLWVIISISSYTSGLSRKRLWHFKEIYLFIPRKYSIALNHYYVSWLILSFSQLFLNQINLFYDGLIQYKFFIFWCFLFWFNLFFN